MVAGVFEASPRSCRSKTMGMGEEDNPPPNASITPVDPCVVGLEHALHLHTMQPDAQGISMSGENGVGGSHLGAVNVGRHHSDTGALAHVVPGKAVGALHRPRVQ